MANTEFNSVIARFVPAAYYRFTDGALTTDSSAGGHTLTDIGVPVEGSPKFGTGAVGLGTSQAFSAVDGADFQPAGNFSISAWIRTTFTGDTQWIFQTWSQNTNIAGIRFQIVAGGNLQLESGKNTGTTWNTDAKQASSTTSGINNGARHHVVGTYDGAKLHLYIDGAEDGTGTAWTNAAVFAATNYVRVGCRNNTGTNQFFFKGSLDEVSFFPSDALSLAQVQSLYAASITDGSNSAIKALASAVYLFEDGAQLTDSSTGGTHTLTAIGTPTTLTTKFGGSVFLGNSSAYSSVDHADFQPTGNFTVGAWIKTSNSATTQLIFSSFSNNTNFAGFYLYVNSSNKIGFVSGKNSGETVNVDYKAIASTNTVTDDNWHFVVATWDGSYLRLYKDGISDATEVAWANAPSYAATNYVRVGAYSLTSTAITTPFLGQLDDVFLLKGRALSSTDIANLYGTYPTSASSQYLKGRGRNRAIFTGVSLG